MRRISVFGATGSIGESTFDLLMRQGGPSAYDTVALTGGRNVVRLAGQARALGAEIAVTAHEDCLPALREALDGSGIEAAAGTSALIEAAGDPDVKAPTIKEIDEWLLAQRLIGMERLPTKGFYYVPTPAGVDAGLRSEDKVSARGTPYSVLLFTPEAQRMVVEHFIKAEASPAGEAVTEGD